MNHSTKLTNLENCGVRGNASLFNDR